MAHRERSHASPRRRAQRSLERPLHSVGTMSGTLANAVDLIHAMAMLVWGLGLPLLVWHRFPALSRAYMWYAAAFVVISVVSHQALGECFLTTIARALWKASGGYREEIPFTAVLANAIAGIRPATRTAVLIWETAIFVTSVGTLFCWHKTRKTNGSRAATESPSAMFDRLEPPTFPRNTSSKSAS